MKSKIKGTIWQTDYKSRVFLREGTEWTNNATDVEIIFNSFLCFSPRFLALCKKRGTKKGLLLPGSAHICGHPKRIQGKAIFASLFMAQVNRFWVFWKDLPAIGKLPRQWVRKAIREYFQTQNNWKSILHSYSQRLGVWCFIPSW